MRRILANPMLLAFLAIMCLLFAGCCPKIVPQSTTTTVTHDTIEKIVKRDTVILIPGKEVHINSGVNCDSLHRAQLKKQVIKKDGLTETVEIKDGKLTASCNEDSLRKLLQIREKQITILKAITTKEVNNVEVWKMHWWQTFLAWVGVISLFVVVLYVAKKIFL